MGGGDQKNGAASAIPVEDAFSWMFRPPVTQEQTDAWFQPPAAQPSELPTPPEPPEAYQSPAVRYLLNDVRQGILPDEALAEIKRDPTSLRSMMAYGEGALGVGTLLAGGEGVKLPKAEVPHYFGGPKPENMRLPIFTTTSKEGAGWYAGERGVGGKVHEVSVDAKNPLKLFNEQQVRDDLLPALDEAGVQYDYRPSTEKIGWDLRIPDIAKHSPYYGENHLDVAYIPQVRDVLVKRGYDSIQANDVLEQGEIPTTVLIKHPDQMQFKGEVAPKLPAGEGFVWGAKPIDQIQGLPKSGVMPESRFAKAGSEAGQFSGDELALMKQVVPDAFTQGGVDVPKLHEGLAQSGPVVEVKKLGESVQTPEAQRLAAVTHQLDTTYPAWRGFNESTPLVPEARTLITEHNNLRNIVDKEVSSAQYAFVGPKPENQMPGYVEGLVRLPRTWKTDASGSTGVERPMYTGPHFGAEDQNVLSSYRGYEETLPNGEKAFHVIEVQSDWGQKIRDNQERIDRGDYSSGNTTKGMDHPLLPHYETLGLKAAIQHAKEIGATKVILPDAETAMMTEGHDRVLPAGDVIEPGEAIGSWRPPQEGGMRLHYDKTLPSAMRKLTGDKGTPVDLGTHKMAVQAQTPGGENLPRDPEFDYKVGGSPVFKDAAGNPKTNITGKIYDISKTPDQFKLMKAGDKFSAAKYLPS